MAPGLGLSGRSTASSTGPGGGTGCAVSTSTAVNNTGWINIDFTAIASGAPLSKLPVDPNNNNASCRNTGSTTALCQYAFVTSSTLGVYKLEALMESAKFFSGTGTEVVTNDKDGGIYSGTYEIGSNLSLTD